MHCETGAEKTDLDSLVEYPLEFGPYDGSYVAIGGFFSGPGLPVEIVLKRGGEAVTYALQPVRGVDGELKDLVYRFRPRRH